jgi:hypothetical protein
MAKAFWKVTVLQLPRTTGSKTFSAGQEDISTVIENTTRPACIYRFTVRSLPDARAYTVDLGKLGGLRYSLDELTKTGWKVDLNVGIGDGSH